MTEPKGNRFFDDMGKLMTDAMGMANGMREEMQTMVRNQMKSFMQGMDLVSREEFDVVKAMAERAREENEALKARIDALESKVNFKDI